MIPGGPTPSQFALDQTIAPRVIRREVDPMRMVDEAMRQAPDKWPARVLAGRNWPYSRSGFVVQFAPVHRHYMIEPNDPDADSIVEWQDGYMTILRTDREPSIGDSPVVFGKAGRAIGIRTAKAGGKQHKHKGKR